MTQCSFANKHLCVHTFIYLMSGHKIIDTLFVINTSLFFELVKRTFPHNYFISVDASTQHFIIQIHMVFIRYVVFVEYKFGELKAK